MKISKSFTVIIPFYNEEKNLINALRSIERQKLSKTLTFSVVLAPNGSTDKSIELATRFIKSRKNSMIKYRIQIFKRPSKSIALNKIVSQEKSDIIFSMDADCILAEDTIEKVLNEFNKNKNILLVGAWDVPIYPKVVKNFLLYEYSRVCQLLRESQLTQTFAMGRLMAFRKNIFPGFPELVAGEDTWISLYIAKNYGTRSIKILMDTFVYFAPPSTWQDFINQQIRWRMHDLQIFKLSPDLKKTYEKLIVEKWSTSTPKIVSKKLKSENIPIKRLEEHVTLHYVFDEAARDGIDEFCKLLSTGTWIPNASTKMLKKTNI